MAKEFIKFCNLNNFTEILEFYNDTDLKTKKIIENIYKASYRFALAKTQTKYLLEQIINASKETNDNLLNDFL